jgi:hypothetical protein
LSSLRQDQFALPRNLETIDLPHVLDLDGGFSPQEMSRLNARHRPVLTDGSHTVLNGILGELHEFIAVDNDSHYNLNPAASHRSCCDRTASQ